MQPLSRWSLATAASAVVNAAAAAVLAAFLVPQPIEQQPASRARLEIATLAVRTGTAEELGPDGEDAQEVAPKFAAAGFGRIPAARSESHALPAVMSFGLSVEGAPVGARSPEAAAASLADTSGARAPAKPISGMPIEESFSPSEHAVAAPFRSSRPARIEVAATRIPTASAAPTATAAAVELPGGRLPAAEPGRDPVRFAELQRNDAIQVGAPERAAPVHPVFSALAESAEIESAALSALATPGEPLRPNEPQVESAAATQPEPATAFALAASQSAAPVITPEVERIAVLLAWSGDLSVELRQPTLDAAAALLVADPDPGEDALRDKLAGRLREVRCARAQTYYDPASGALDLLGHVRTDADRDALLAAIELELQGAIPIVDRLRRLGEPQCTVLSQLSEMPLPQSVEQFTNPLIIGPDLHTRVYRFADGEVMRFDLAGADYDGWIYLDYYDSDGQVLHLVPNTAIGPLVLGANRVVTFGGGGPDDIASGRIQMRVSPPFGQDVAVAIVTSRPLFEGPRATVEPAKPYLDELASRIRQLREDFEDFRGEWVYLLVETQPGR